MSWRRNAAFLADMDKTLTSRRGDISASDTIMVGISGTGFEKGSGEDSILEGTLARACAQGGQDPIPLV
jgi:hypothetical protein